MEPTWRTIEATGLEAFLATAEGTFGKRAPADTVEAVARAVEYDRTHAAFEGDRVVATAALLSWRLATPGASLAAGALTGVGVLATHRSRGLFAQAIGRCLDDAADRGEPVSVLLSSDSGLYRRFGYGPATFLTRVVVDTHHTDVSVPPTPGRLEQLEPGPGFDELAALWARTWTSRPGELSASDGFWAMEAARRTDDEGTIVVVVHRDDDDTVDGAVLYRHRPRWDGIRPAHRIDIDLLVAPDPAVRLALWAHCLGLSLVSEVTAVVPADDPVRWCLSRPRELRTTAHEDWLWVRVLDVVAALEGRTYPVADTFVLDVVDTLRPTTAGRYRLTTGAEPTCARSTDAGPVDVRLDVADLGSLLLGGVAAGPLAAAGRLEVAGPEVTRRLDLAFSTSPAPFCQLDF